MRVEKRIQKGIREIREGDFDIGLDAAQATMAFPRGKAPKSAWLRPVSLFAGGMVVVASSLFMLVPSRAVGLDDIQMALESAPARHTRLVNARGQVIYELWREGSKRRLRFGYEVDQGYNGKLVWHAYLKERYTVLSSRQPRRFDDNVPSLEKEIQSHQEQATGKPEVSRRQVEVEGETYLEVIVESRPKIDPAFVKKSVLLCRISDNLPVRVDYFWIHHGKERKGGSYISEYPSDLPDSVFDPHIPDGFAILDEKGAHEQVVNRLTNQAYRQVVNGVPITLLGVFVEAGHSPAPIQGRAFALFMGGATPHIDATAGLFDEQDKGYPAFLYFHSDDPNRPRNYGKAGPPLPKNGKVHGKTADFPQHVRPLFFLQNQPVYCVRFTIEPDRLKEPWQVKVALPASTETAPRVLRAGKQGPYVQGVGKQVGTATFTDTTISVQSLGSIISQFDRKVYLTGALPIKGINVDLNRASKLTRFHPQ